MCFSVLEKLAIAAVLQSSSRTVRKWEVKKLLRLTLNVLQSVRKSKKLGL